MRNIFLPRGVIKSRFVRPSSRIDTGFTLVELMVATTAMMIILGAFGIFTSQLFTSETSTVTSENASVTTRGVLDQMQSDIQAANPIDPLSTVSQYANELELQLGPTGAQQNITWAYDSSTQTLTRTVYSSSTSSVEVELYGVANSSSQPVFTYYGAQGNNLALSSGAAGIATCTTMVSIYLVVTGGKNAESPVHQLNVQLLNPQAGGSSCT